MAKAPGTFQRPAPASTASHHLSTHFLSHQLQLAEPSPGGHSGRDANPAHGVPDVAAQDEAPSSFGAQTHNKDLTQQLLRR